MYVVGREEMQAMERYTIEEIGLPGEVLMENAGSQVINEIVSMMKKKPGANGRHKGLILAGGGNNGGDGFVIARRLLELGWEIHLCLFASPDKINGEAKTHYQVYVNKGYPLTYVTKNNIAEMEDLIYEAPVIVDALLGTGVLGKVREQLAQAIAWVNQYQEGKEIIAVDIPSGLCSNTGKVENIAIQATKTVTFAFPKKGFFLQQGPRYIGEWKAVDISVSPSLVEKLHLPCSKLITVEDVKRSLPKRFVSGHKGTFGHVLVIGGSKQLVGAPLFSAKAALYSGAGLVTLAVPESIYIQASAQFPSSMFMPLPDDNDGYFALETAEVLRNKLDEYDAIIIGPGLGRWEPGKEWLRMLLSKPVHKPVIIDADGLFLLSEQKELLRQFHSSLIITPHPGEMARLLGTTVKEIESNRIQIATQFAKENKINLILKGHRSISATPHGQIYINPVGNDALAKGGSGDVLAGMLAGFLAQQVSPLQSMISATYVHGRTGEQLAKKHSRYSVIADGLIQHIGKTIQQILHT